MPKFTKIHQVEAMQFDGSNKAEIDKFWQEQFGLGWRRRFQDEELTPSSWLVCPVDGAIRVVSNEAFLKEYVQTLPAKSNGVWCWSYGFRPTRESEAA